jgi:hypothetical protein
VVAPDEEVDVADVVGLEDDDGRRRAGVEPLPDVARSLGWGERVEERDLAVGLDDRGADERLPARLRVPGGVLDPPEPEARRDVSNLLSHPRILAAFARRPTG